MKKLASLAVLSILLKNNYAAYYIGSKSRNELHNELNPTNKLITQDIHIFTNANTDEVTKIFKNNEVKNDILNTVIVKFGGFEFEISTCPICIDKSDTNKFMDERDNRDITINTIAQDINGKYIDYTYTYRNQKISAIKDLKEQKIRCVGNPYQRFADDPLRIFRIFRIMSQTGYDIDKTTLKAAAMHLDLLKNISTMQIGDELNKLIIGKHADKALMAMKKIGLFNAKTFNPFLNQEINILPLFKKIKEEQLQDLIKFNNYRYHREGYNFILDSWFLLLQSFDIDEAMENLTNIHPINFEDIEKVEWLLKNKNIIYQDDLRTAFLNAKNGIVKNKFFIFHELLNKLIKVNVVLNGIEGYEKAKQVWFEFCSRPYYIDQINSNDVCEILKIEHDTIVNTIKENMLPKILKCDKYPYDDKYKEIVLESAREAGIVC